MQILSRLSVAFTLAASTLVARPATAEAWPAIFDPLELRTLYLNLDPEDWDTVRHDLTFDIEVPAYFHAQGEDRLLVSVRRKSAFALPSEEDPQKVSLKIDINEFVKQKWHDLNKVSLENGDDQDVVREGLAWHMHRLAWEAGMYP